MRTMQEHGRFWKDAQAWRRNRPFGGLDQAFRLFGHGVNRGAEMDPKCEPREDQKAVAGLYLSEAVCGAVTGFGA